MLAVLEPGHLLFCGQQGELWSVMSVGGRGIQGRESTHSLPSLILKCQQSKIVCSTRPSSPSAAEAGRTRRRCAAKGAALSHLRLPPAPAPGDLGLEE